MVINILLAITASFPATMMTRQQEPPKPHKDKLMPSLPAVLLLVLSKPSPNKPSANTMSSSFPRRLRVLYLPTQTMTTMPICTTVGIEVIGTRRYQYDQAYNNRTPYYHSCLPNSLCTHHTGQGWSIRYAHTRDPLHTRHPRHKILALH